MATYYGQTVDIVEDFENALTGEWTETDANSVLDPLNATAKYNGNYGLFWESTGSYSANLEHLGTAGNIHTFGLWFRIPTLATDTQGQFYSVEAPDTSATLRVYCQNSGGTYYIRIRNGDGDYGTGIAVSVGTWYWITIKTGASTNMLMRIYNTSHAQVGSEDSVASFTLTSRAHIPTSSTLFTSDVYWDDIVIDYDGGVWPILGWSEVGGEEYIPIQAIG